MELKRGNNCRLCLKVVKNEYLELDEVLKQMFNIILLKLDLNTNSDSVVCQDCVEVAKKSLYFKFTCLCTERIILLFSTGRENAKHDIKVISSEMTRVERGTDEGLGICRFCVTRLERNNFASLDILRNETNMFEMLPEYMPEMDFNIIENPLICASCRENLEDYLKFVMHCLDIERKIKVYCNEEGNGSAEQVFSFENLVEYPGKYTQMCTIKDESNFFENTEYMNHQQTCSQLIKHEELDIKEEGISLEGNFNKDPPKITLGEDDMPKERNVIQYRVWKNQANVIDKKVARHKKTNNVNSEKMYKCSSCAYKSRDKSTFNRHTLIHKDVSEVTMYKCTLCSYESKHKRYLKSHSFVHKDVAQLQMHNCSLCAYAAKQKHGLRKHMVVHKNISEIKMYKCALCSYETRQKVYLRSHLSVHRDGTKLKMYNCSLCSYQTKTKNSLKSHMLIHKDVSEIKMFKCSFCAYESKWKNNVQNHLLAHKDISEIKMHKCSLCSYTCKQKRSLKSHLLKHNNVSEIEIYKCSLCAYETKHNDELKGHILVHRDVSN